MAKPTLLLMGSAGSGKGTQGGTIASAFGYVHAETGALIRATAEQDSDLGRRVKESNNQGKHASDELMTELLVTYLKSLPFGQPLLLDGYPRTLRQADMLTDVLREVGRDADGLKAIWINVRPEVARERLLQRSVCGNCKKVFPTRSVTVCDACSGPVQPRSYDIEAAIDERLKFFETQTKPVIERYRQENRLLEVDGEQPVADVSDRLTALLSEEIK
jgi:adenylate kinase